MQQRMKRMQPHFCHQKNNRGNNYNDSEQSQRKSYTSKQHEAQVVIKLYKATTEQVRAKATRQEVHLASKQQEAQKVIKLLGNNRTSKSKSSKTQSAPSQLKRHNSAICADCCPLK
jgi:hypothetical protein